MTDTFEQQKIKEEIKVILEENGLQWKHDFTHLLVDNLYNYNVKTIRQARIEGAKERQELIRDLFNKAYLTNEWIGFYQSEEWMKGYKRGRGAVGQMLINMWNKIKSLHSDTKEKENL